MGATALLGAPIPSMALACARGTHPAAEPLLGGGLRECEGYPRAHPSATDLSPPGSCVSMRSSCPSSFKARRMRKTKDFIGGQLSEPRRHDFVCSPGGDNQALLEEPDANVVCSKVASMIFQHVQEGEASGGARGPDEDAFHDDNFLQRRWCYRCWPLRLVLGRSRGDRWSQEAVLTFIDNIATSLYFCKQVIVLCAVYTERLLQEAPAKLTRNNWRSVVVATLLVASKVWEDVHPWNADFEDCLREVAGMIYRRGALYRLESLVLDRLRWCVFVDAEVYAAYYFALVSDKRRPPQLDGIGHPRVVGRRKRARSWGADDFPIDTIVEEHLSSDEDSGDGRKGGHHGGGGSSPFSSPHSPSNRKKGSARSLSSARSSATGRTCAEKEVPWSREELSSWWRRYDLEHVGDGGVCRATRDLWKLDARNPNIGALRHAPVARAPSSRLPQSRDLLWANKLASRGSGVFLSHCLTTRRRHGGTATTVTISGATGSQLATELRRYLSNGESQNGAPASNIGVEAVGGGMVVHQTRERGLSAIFD